MWKQAMIISLALLLLFSGCIEPPTAPETCGNGVCDAGETVENCPADCTEPPMPPATGEEGEEPPSLPF